MKTLKEIFRKGRKIIEDFKKKIDINITSLLDKIIAFLKEIYEKSELQDKWG